YLPANLSLETGLEFQQSQPRVVTGAARFANHAAGFLFVGAIAEAASFSAEFREGRLQFTKSHRAQPKLPDTGSVNDSSPILQVIEPGCGGGLTALASLLVQSSDTCLIFFSKCVQERALAHAA